MHFIPHLFPLLLLTKRILLLLPLICIVRSSKKLAHADESVYFRIGAQAKNHHFDVRKGVADLALDHKSVSKGSMGYKGEDGEDADCAILYVEKF